MKMVAYGSNVIAEQIDKHEETIVGKVISSNCYKCPKGSIILYSDHAYTNVWMGKTLYHCIWEMRIQCIEHKEEEAQNDDE
jgi:hypothetical protein